MLFSTTSSSLIARVGAEAAVKMLIDAGFPCIDFSFESIPVEIYTDSNATALAHRLRAMADVAGVTFNQSHAPFGRCTEYLERYVPLFPKAFEFAEILGVKTMVVHPRQTGIYYGHEEELFDWNMEFYSSIAPLAKAHGIRIGIENMWTVHPLNRHQPIDDVCAPPTELCRYYDTLNDPNSFTVCLDLGHVAICAREPDDAIRTVGGKRLGALHVHDVDYKNDLHTLPGLAKINFEKCCRALAEVDYMGEFTMEIPYYFTGFPTALLPDAARLAARVGAHWAARVDAIKAELKEEQK